MPHDQQFAMGGPDAIPLVQVREEAQWPFQCTMDLRQDYVIAGVLKEPNKERLSIHRAMQRGLLTRETGLALLEAQAASGYIIDPLRNRKLSVRDAANTGLVGRDHFNTLVVAEKAVTGYIDPYTGHKISLFQAMKKGLMARDHGIRLLEVQVATGGIVHPLHSHRIPVELAYKWGYLDGEICHLISDPAGHTKRCFDPNAHESLTYSQLLQRCVPDPETGLLMLQVADKGSVISHLDANTRRALQSAFTTVNAGLFQGQEISVWDLLFSRYISTRKRQELLRQYKAGTITLQDVTQILTTLIADTETKRDLPCGMEESPVQEMACLETERKKCASEQEDMEKTLKSRMVKAPLGEFHGKKVSVWDLLHSKYIPKEKRKEIMKLYQTGILTIDQMETVVTGMVARIQAARAKESGHVTCTDQEMSTSEEGNIADPQEQQLRRSLQLVSIPVSLGEFKGQNVPLWDILSSKYFPQDKRQELLGQYRAGELSTGQMTTAVSRILEKQEASRKSLLVRVKSRIKKVSGSKEGKAADALSSKHLDDLLRSKLVTLPAGEFKGQQLSVWDLLFSQYIARDKRDELLKKYRDGTFNVEELASVLTILASLHDLFFSLDTTANKTSRRPKAQNMTRPAMMSLEEDDDDDDEDDDNDDDDDDEEDAEKDKALKSRMVEVSVSEFRGHKVSLWDLLHSKYFPEKKRKEVLKLYRVGVLTIDQMQTVITAIVTKVGEQMDKEAGPTSSHGPGATRQTERAYLQKRRPRKKALAIQTIEFPVGEFQGRRVSMWDLLFSSYIPEIKRQELLMGYLTGMISSEEMLSILTALIMESHKQRSSLNIQPGLNLLHPEASCVTPLDLRASMHDLLYSQEHDAHRAGSVTVSEITVTTTVFQGPAQKQG